MQRRRWILCVAAAAAAAACTARPAATDIGFQGTWARQGIIADYRSTISILKDGDRWLWRWKMDTADGTWKVRCNWEGHCDEHLDGKKIGEYTFQVRQEEGEDFLTVECTRKALREGDAGYHYVDEVVLQPGGKAIRAFTLRLDDQTYTREATRVLELQKVSDTVADPPPGFRS